MTSIGSYTKQIPLNNGYFRAISTVNTLYTPATVDSSGSIASMDAAETDYPVGTLFKDMGTQAVVAGSTFRRIQEVTASPATGGVGGSVPDYLSYWILTGFNGAGAPGSPLVRTG